MDVYLQITDNIAEKLNKKYKKKRKEIICCKLDKDKEEEKEEQEAEKISEKNEDNLVNDITNNQ